MDISVIIPSTGKDSLKIVLRSILFASKDVFKVEVLVIDDSERGSLEEEIGEEFNWVRFFKSYKRGPASARNLGLKYSCGKIIVFIGDDIVVSSNFLKEHYLLHKNSPLNICGVGKVLWHPSLKRTQVMEVIQEEGLWFNYRLGDERGRLTFECFYTSNASLKKEFLGELLFDEDFRYPAFEDTYIGYLLANKGAEFVYLPQALAYHYHYWNLKSVFERIKILESSRKLMISKIGFNPWPEKEPSKSLFQKITITIFIFIIYFFTFFRLFFLLDIILRVLRRKRGNWVYVRTISTWHKYWRKRV